MRGGESSDESTAFIGKWTPTVLLSRWPRTAAVTTARGIRVSVPPTISGTSFTMDGYADDGEYFYYRVQLPVPPRRHHRR